MDLKLKDKYIVVTGGANGIGSAIVSVLSEEGAIPIIVDRDQKRAEQTLASVDQ